MHIDIIFNFFDRVFDADTIEAQPLKDAMGNAQKYMVSGQINVPHITGAKSVQIQSTVAFPKDAANHPEFIECEGSAELGTWDIAGGIVLSGGMVRLVNRNGKGAVFISGALRVIDCDCIEVGGDLDAEILRDPEDSSRLYIGTLVTNAFLFIGTKPAIPEEMEGRVFSPRLMTPQSPPREFEKTPGRPSRFDQDYDSGTESDLFFQGATIKLELCTKYHDSSKPLPYFIDELNELLFQCNETIPLGSWSISGIGKDPLTLSISVNALSAGLVQTNLMVSPARLRIPFMGEDTYLFIAGQKPGGFFSVNLKGKWESFVSSTPRISFVASAYPNNPTIIEGASNLTGSLKAEGLSRAALSLSSELVDAKVFPSGAWPQKMPEQKLSLEKTPDCPSQFHGHTFTDPVFKFYPLSIDGFRISNGNGEKKLLEGTLCPRGLLFKKGYWVSRESTLQKSRELPEFIIDGSIKIWVNAGEKEVELKEWLKSVE